MNGVSYLVAAWRGAKAYLKIYQWGTDESKMGCMWLRMVQVEEAFAGVPLFEYIYIYIGLSFGQNGVDRSNALWASRNCTYEILRAIFAVKQQEVNRCIRFGETIAGSALFLATSFLERRTGAFGQGKYR